MLHQRRRWFLLVSRKSHWQVLDEQARTKAKWSEARSSAAERAMGHSTALKSEPASSNRHSKCPSVKISRECCADSCTYSFNLARAVAGTVRLCMIAETTA